MKFPVITLCGSTKFKDDFIRVAEDLERKGNMTINLAVFTHANGYSISEEDKKMFDLIHRQKIDMSDMIMVINKDGYIGESTRSEIEYAKEHGKEILYMEPVNSD